MASLSVIPMRKALLTATLCSLTLFFAGCGSSTSSPGPGPTPVPPPVTGGYAGTAFSGKVAAGAVPLVGATVQVYSAGVTGNGSAPTQLLSAALTTDSTGAFSVPAGYECPAGTSVLYIVAKSGHPGASGSSNGAIELISSPGACSSITAGATYVLNEATTVASAYAFAPFLKPGPQLGASSTNAGGITLAAGTLANLVNTTTGAAPGAQFPGNGTAPTARINALADMLNACVASSGASAAPCANLFAATTGAGSTPANTLDAMLNLVHQPATNVSTIFGLASASTSYPSALASAPSDWTLFIPFTGGGMNDPAAIAIDSGGRVWASNYNGVASLFTNTGAPVFTGGITGNGLFNSYGIAVDASDNAWVTNEQSPGGVNGGLGSVTELNPAGQPLSGGSGYSQGGLNFPIAVAFDSSSIAWIADYGDSHLTLLNSSGVPQSGSGGYSSSQLALPVAIAVDSKRNGWLADFPNNSVTEFSSDGATVKAYACGSGPTGVAVDGSDNIWITDFSGNSVTLLSTSGTALSGGGYTGGGMNQPQSVAIDGAGTAWIANYRGRSLTELAGAASATPGQALSPAAGWGPEANLLEAFGIAIDAGGNVWVSGFGNSTLTEFVGLAVPVKTPLLGPVRIP